MKVIRLMTDESNRGNRSGRDGYSELVTFVVWMVLMGHFKEVADSNAITSAQKVTAQKVTAPLPSRLSCDPGQGTRANPLSQAMDRSQTISIGVKIFGLASSLLGLLFLVATLSAQRLRQVKDEIVVLAEYVIPITEQVALIDVHVLEQELHFERIQTLYRIEPINAKYIAEELALFEQRGQWVDESLAIAIDYIDTALTDPSARLDPETQRELDAILPQLHHLDAEHQAFHDQTVELLILLEQGQFQTAQSLEAPLLELEEKFNHKVNALFLELEAFTVNAAQSGQEHQQNVLWFSCGITAIATLFGVFYAAAVSRKIVQPVQQLSRGVHQVRQGDLEIELRPTTRDEIRTLTHSFNSMVQELRRKAQLEETFGKYVDPRIIQNVMSTPTGATTEGTRQTMTTFFSDVEGFAEFIPALSADVLVQATNDYLNLMSTPISDHSGVIDKFIGTLIMGFWGPPFTTDDDQAIWACEAALAQVGRMTTLRTIVNHYYSAMEPASSDNTSSDTTIQGFYPTLDLHIGIATGSLVVGNMGSESARSYTVMGDTVNIASRLKGASKQYGVQILMTAATQQRVASQMVTRELDRIQVVGKEEPIQIFELLGKIGSLSQEAIATYDRFHQGLLAYRQRQWDAAQSHFSWCLQTMPSDRPSQLYRDRIAHFRHHPPPPDWDGVWQLTKK